VEQQNVEAINVIAAQTKQSFQLPSAHDWWYSMQIGALLKCDSLKIAAELFVEMLNAGHEIDSQQAREFLRRMNEVPSLPLRLTKQLSYLRAVGRLQPKRPSLEYTATFKVFLDTAVDFV